MRNVKLDTLIIESGMKKFEISQEMGWHQSKLSLILSGSYEPSSMEKEDLCAVIGCGVEEAFGKRRKVVKNA